jgi:hypothetical protein
VTQKTRNKTRAQTATVITSTPYKDDLESKKLKVDKKVNEQSNASVAWVKKNLVPPKLRKTLASNLTKRNSFVLFVQNIELKT